MYLIPSNLIVSDIVNMKNYLLSAVRIIILIILAVPASAQKKSDIPSQNQWITAIVDAKQEEWGDSLKNFDSDTKFHYSIANDNDNIYLAIAVSDKQRIQNIIAGGITFFINTEGKKKEGQAITFPVLSPHKQPQKTNPEQAIRKSVASAKAIKVMGFEKILDGSISVNNDFGIKAAAALTDSGQFIYEAAIPLERLNLTAGSGKELSINIKLNIPDHPPRVSRMYESPYETQRRRNRGDYSSPQSRTVISTTAPAGFWIKRTLATASLAK